MNPDNNSLNRTYFIAGPPRVGKTLLAYTLAKNINGHVVSTDAIRSAAKKACLDKSGQLFKINSYNKMSEDEWLNLHLNKPEQVVDDQNKESHAFWRSVVSFCNTFTEDSENHIVEGVALLPELVASMDNKPKHIVYIGNTSDEHVQSMLKYSQDNAVQDWMSAMGYGEDRIRAMATFVQEMSVYFKQEAQKYGFEYIEMSDDDFDINLEEAVRALLKQ